MSQFHKRNLRYVDFLSKSSFSTAKLPSMRRTRKYLCLWQVLAILMPSCAGLLAQPAQSTNTFSSAAELGVKKLQPAAGLKVELFAAEPLLRNPVSFSIDEKGRFFVVETHRY